MAVTFEEGDICKVTNLGDDPITFGWNSRSYTIKPKEAKVVPIFAAVTAFGDPRSLTTMRSWRSPHSNEVGWIPDRSSEIRRLRMRYGLIDGNETTLCDRTGFVPERVPDVKVELMDGGDFIEVATVISDPDGNGAVLDEAPAIDIQTLQASLEKTQRQLAMLISQSSDEGLAYATEDDIPTDDPQAAIVDSKPAAKSTLTKEQAEATEAKMAPVDAKTVSKSK